MKNNIKKLTIVFVMLGFAALLTYQAKRDSAMGRLSKEMAGLAEERRNLALAQNQLEHLKQYFPKEADIVRFMETLYLCGTEAGLQAHEVATVKSVETDSPESAQRRARAEKKGSDLGVFRLKISMVGNYRQVAEYVRLVQNIEQFKKITSLVLVPEKGQVKGSLELELYSLRGQNGA